MEHQNAEWLEVLRAEVACRSQSAVAEQLGVSKTMISQVLSGKYPSDPVDLRSKVEGRFMKRTVQCPILGEITVDKCRFHQGRPFASTNPQRVLLYRACRSGCPNSQLDATMKNQRIHLNQVPGMGDTGDKPYQVDNQVAFCRRMAGDDEAKHVELLERELSRLATQYNLLLWQMQHKESK